jgi:hypothetical protein
MTQYHGNAALDFEPYRQNYPASTPTKALDLNLKSWCLYDRSSVVPAILNLTLF